MAVTKINGFRAPYRSQTFQEIASAHTQRNGVMQMAGIVTQSGMTITIPAFTFIQQGLIVEKDTATTITASSMDAPFYLAVSSPNTANVDNLIFTFAKSPADITAQEAILAAWDGVEWRMLPFLSFDGVFDDSNQANVDFDLVGPFSGVNTTVDGLNYKNSSGVVVDRSGLRQKLVEDNLFVTPPNELDWGRVDRVIYRRPKDDDDRIGVRKFFIGSAFAAAPANLYNTQGLDASNVRRDTKVLTDSANNAHIFVASGYGGSFSIDYKKIASDRTTILVAATSLATGLSSTGFDVAIDSSNNLYLVYVSGGDLKWRKFSSVGAPLTAVQTIDAQIGRCLNPKITIDPQNSKSFVVYQSLVAPSQDQIYLVTVDLGGSIATPSQNITGDAFNNISPSICVTDDYLVYVAWESLTETKIKYRVYNDIGTPQGLATTVSDNTEEIGAGTLVNLAKSPKIWVTDNKKVIISFLQDKGGSVHGLSLWEDGVAFMQQLITAGENFTYYDIYIDPALNGFHIAVSRSTSLDFVRMNARVVSFVLNLAVTGVAGLSTVRDTLGSMLTSWSTPVTATYSSYDVLEPILCIGLTSKVGTLNTLNLAADECLVASTILQAPKAGDQVVITGSGFGNDGTYAITAVTLESLDALNDRYRVQVTPAFTAAENTPPAVNGDFQEPDGNESRYVKSTASTTANAFTLDVLDTDLLLSRIVTPGPVILNYPAGGGPGGSGADYLLVYGASVAIDWESTTAGELTVAGGIKILDLLNNFTYSVADGAFPMVEGDALYVELNGLNFSPTAQVTSIATLPFSLPIQVLGVIKDGEFNPHLLSHGGMEQLDSGEAIVFGENLHNDQRSRLGITGETTYEAFTSQIGLALPSVSIPNALSQTNIMAGQNKHVRLVRGEWSWVSPNADELVVITESFIQVPGVAENRNRIAPQTINLTADGQVAYVSINRTGAGAADLTVNVSSISSLAVDRNTIILARRLGSDVQAALTESLLVPGMTTAKIPALHVSTDYSSFGGGLSAADTDVQKALDTLDDQVGAILANNPMSETITSAGQTTFTATTLTWDASNLALDIEVYVNGRKYDVDPTGVRNWKKTSTTSILFAFTVPNNAEVTIWKQGTAVAVAGGTDLTNITVHPQPAVNGAKSLGQTTKAWGSVFIKDKATSQVYELEIVSGVLQATAVP